MTYLSLYLHLSSLFIITLYLSLVSDVGAVVKVTESHPCGRGSIPDKSYSFFYSLLTQVFITTLQSLKYWMPREASAEA